MSHTEFMQWSKLVEWGWNLIAPVQCCICGTNGWYLCDTCFDQIEFAVRPLTPLPPLTTLRACTVYQRPMSAVIQTGKYGLVKAVGPWLGWLLYYHVSLPPFEMITAVPADPVRLRQRGFHLPDLIAHSLSLLTNIPYVPLLQKTQSTPPQAQSDVTHRQHLSASIFTYAPAVSLAPPSSVLLVDDVVTTGTTLKLCAQCLAGHGYQDIHGLAVAHGV